MKQKAKLAVISLAAVLALSAGTYFMCSGAPSLQMQQPVTEAKPVVASNALLTATSETQIINIIAKVGYTPLVSEAKANVPTVLHVTTKSTFDCSAALTIPSIGFRERLPMTGAIDIPVPPQASGTELNGVCAMGMYSFVVKFS